MELVRVAGSCASQACPTVYSTENGDVVVQGLIVPDPAIEGGLPHGEATVRVPRQLLIDAAARLEAGR
jgi:hypothetical protein